MESRRSPQHRHDGSSPLPLGMDASPAPSKWEGVNTVWPHDPSTGWSYCATIPSWVVIPEAKTAQGTFINPTVYYRVLVGIQSPEGVTAVNGILRRFSDFMKLHAALKNTFKKKRIPAAPPKNPLLRMNSSHTLIQERRHALHEWLSTLLEDIEISRSAPIAAFLELEAAARSAVNTISNAQEESGSVVAGPPVPQPPLWTSSVASGTDYASDAACSASGARSSTAMSELGTEADTESTVETAAAQIKLKGKEIQNTTDLDRKVSDTILESVQKSKDSDSDLASEPSVSASVNGPSDTSMILVAGIERRMEGLPNFEADFLKGVTVLLPADQRGNVKRVLSAVQRRFEIVKADMEELIARLNQEVAVKEFLTLKVRDLESELDNTKRRAQDELRQALSVERDRVIGLQWDLEDCRAALLNAEESLQAERNGKTVDQGQLRSLETELETTKQQAHQLKEKLDVLCKEKDASEAQARAEKKILVKEIKALRKSQPELKEELLQARAELEETLKREKDKQEVVKTSRARFIHEVSALRQRLQECSVDVLAREDDRNNASDVMELLVTSDNRISLLLAEAGLMVHEDENVEADSLKQELSNGTADMETETGLRKLLVDMLIENAKLRKGMNALTRSAFLTVQMREKETAEEPIAKWLLSRFL